MPGSLWIFALLLLTTFCRAQDLASARAFVQQLYGAYEHPASPAGPDVLGKSATCIFSPLLLQLIRRDQARTPGGDAPALDGDPICDCQDFEGLKLLSLDLAGVDASHVSANAKFQVFANDPKSVRSARLSLLYTPQGWRIDDIATSDTPSLRKFLQKSR